MGELLWEKRDTLGFPSGMLGDFGQLDKAVLQDRRGALRSTGSGNEVGLYKDFDVRLWCAGKNVASAIWVKDG